MSFEGTEQSRVTYGGPLAGKNIVVSGTFAGFTREGIKAAIEAAGWQANGVSYRATPPFIIAGSDMGPSKRAKAMIGIPDHFRGGVHQNDKRIIVMHNSWSNQKKYRFVILWTLFKESQIKSRQLYASKTPFSGEKDAA
ncbi:MAG: hypothetical protein U5L72_19840 [Bacteroidales bacterium]|nr:hypothetical protein [Bacteroidales bacterium]